MNPIQIKAKPITINGGISATLLEITIEGGVCAPEDLKSFAMPEVPGNAGVIISGRTPMWLSNCIMHECHATRFTASFDPRLEGAVVTSVHARLPFGVGDIVKID